MNFSDLRVNKRRKENVKVYREAAYEASSYKNRQKL